MLSFINWLFLVATAIAALFQYWAAGKPSTDKHGGRLARLAIVLLLLATLASFYGNSQEQADHVNRVLESIERSLDKIEDVSVDFRASIPASESDVAGFKARLLANSDTCLGASKALEPWPVMSECLEDLRKDPTAHLRLGTAELLLNFFLPKTPGRPRHPDLSMVFSVDLRDGSLILNYDPLEDRFLLVASALKPNFIEAAGDIVSLTDLRNAEVEIRIRPAERNARAREERLRLEVINLNFRGAHTWSRRISRAETKPISGPPYPTYLYRIGSGSEVNPDRPGP